MTENSEREKIIATLAVVANRSYDDHLEQSYDALFLLIRILEDGVGPDELRPFTPLRRLVAALSDRLGGGDPELLSARSERPGAPPNRSYGAAQGAVAACMELAVQSGLSLSDASRLVAKECKSLGICDHKGQEMKASQIKKMRGRAGDNLPANAQRVFDEITKTNPIPMGSTETREYIRSCLRAVLDTGIAGRTEKSKKPPPSSGD